MRGGNRTYDVGSSRPWSTRISPHTLTVFLFAFFFGIAISATSCVILTACVGAGCAVEESEVAKEEMEEMESVEERARRQRCDVGYVPCHAH